MDEALDRAEKFLDDALLAELRERAGHPRPRHRASCGGRSPQFLREHPLVAQFAAAPPEQGGGGVTVVELKD